MIVTHTIQKDLSFPSFFKYGDGAFFKVINESVCIQVDTYDFGYKIERSSGGVPFLILRNDATQIDEAEFNEAFESVLNKINQLTPQTV